MKYLTLNLILFAALASQISAQPLLKDGKIPDDLIITVKKQEGWGGTYSEMTINAKGEFSSISRGGLPVSGRILSSLLINGKSVKPPKYLKRHLSEEKLKLLIAEFEKIQFFKFGEDFPVEDEKEVTCITDTGSEGVFFQINGQNKQVSTDGCFSKKSRLVIDLAEMIRGAGVWNYENEEIPENFEVSYQLPDQDNIRREFKIKANGEVIQSVITIQPFSMKVIKVGKISKRKIKELIDEFEKVRFSAFRFSTLSKYDGCLNELDLPTNKRMHINVQINYIRQMYASLYQNCNAKPETRAAKFEYMANVIEKLLKNVGAMK